MFLDSVTKWSLHSRLLHYRTITKVRLKWVKNRSLDHIINVQTDVKAACLLKDAIVRSPTAYLTSKSLLDSQKLLGLTVPTLRFIHPKYPSLPCFKLTQAGETMQEMEQAIYKDCENDIVERLCRVLMMTRSKMLPLQSLHPLKWDLGLPDDYATGLIRNHANHFQVVKGTHGSNCLKLVDWPEEFSVSTLQKVNEKNGCEYRDFKRGKAALEFPMSFPRGYGARKKVKAWMDEFQKLPYISPYEEFRGIDPNSELMEKRVVGVLHEFLHLTIHKKTKRNYLRSLREELGLPDKFTRIFTRYPGIFYLTLKCKTTTVAIREGYQRGKLVDPHPIAKYRDKFLWVMRNGLIYRNRANEMLPRNLEDYLPVDDGVEEEGEEEEENDDEASEECYDSESESSYDDNCQGMDPPGDDDDLKPEKLEQEKEGGGLYQCSLYDADVVRKIAQEFLPGLASACVDNTTGGIFRSPASVAVDIRREMIDYLTMRSENFLAEATVLDDDPPSDDPYDIISDLVDDFASSKRNFFSRVSGWVLSERREDRIDDFVQEMEMNGFWLLSRRESVAQALLKNVDFKRSYHCNMKFNHPDEMQQHMLSCSFRTMTCPNEGCNASFSAGHSENHDSNCPFKILRCEQNCQDMIMRREMDRHCITVCPMKLVKCPFYSVGCNSSVPHCRIDEHRLENLNPHLVHILQLFHKEASADDLNNRADELIKLSSPGKLTSPCDARSLTFMVKDLEAILGPLKVKAAEPVVPDTTADEKETPSKSDDISIEEGAITPVETEKDDAEVESEDSIKRSNHLSSTEVPPASAEVGARSSNDSSSTEEIPASSVEIGAESESEQSTKRSQEETHGSAEIGARSNDSSSTGEDPVESDREIGADKDQMVHPRLS